jgi:hypothetical protein
MAGYIALILSTLLSVLALFFKEDRDKGSPNHTSFIKKLSRGGWILLSVIIIAGIVSVISFKEDNAQKDRERDEYIKHQVNLYQKDSMNLAHHVELLNKDNEILKLKADNAFEQLQSIKTTDSNIFKNILENNYPLFPLKLEISFINDAICDEGYTDTSSNPYFSRFSKKRLKMLLEKIRSDNKTSVSDLKIKVDEEGRYSFEFQNFQTADDINYSENLRELIKFLKEGYMPDLVIDFYTSGSKNSVSNAQKNLQLVCFKNSINHRITTISYSEEDDNFTYIFEIDEFETTLNDRSVRSFYNLINGFVTVNLLSRETLFFINEPIKFKFGNIRYEPMPVNGLRGIKQCKDATNRFIVEGKSFLLAKSVQQ